MIYYVQDLYPREDPRDGARLVRFSHLQLAEYLDQRNGTGSGKIALRSTSPDAAFIDSDGLDYVRVRRVNTAVVDGGTPSGFSEAVVGGYFLEADEHLALDRNTKRLLTLNGAGTLSYLDREAMWSHTYEVWGNDPSEGEQPDTWNLFAQSTIFAGGDFLGAILWRIVHEGLGFRGAPGYAATPTFPDDKTESAIPFVVLTFDGFEDTDGNPWTVPSGDFTAQVGESLLAVTKRLMEAGLYVELDPDTFELRAWEVANHGRDRTGGAWGAAVIRFVPPPDEDRTKGNVLNDLKRSQVAKIRRTQILSGGQDVYGTATAAGDVPWHGFYGADVSDVGALDAIAVRQIGARNDAGDMVQVRIKVGNDPANGYYLPGEHILVDDAATLHNGTGEWDWNEASYPVAAWSVKTRRSGAPDVYVHLGSTYSVSDRQFQVGGGGSPCPCLRLCGGESGSNVMLALAAGAIKVSSTGPNPKTDATDGDDDTLSHWTANIANGVDEEYFAADLGAAVDVTRYRVVQGYSVIGAAQPEGATEMRLYGAPDDGGGAAAYAWLPGAKLSADPAANGWTLVATIAGSATGSDTGPVDIAVASFRYWVLRASAGPAAGVGEGWNLQELELWDVVSGGTTHHAAPCIHGHVHNTLTGRSVAATHPASSVTETTDGDVQTAIDNLRAQAIPDILNEGPIALDDLSDVVIGGSEADPEQTILDIITDLTASDFHDYQVTDSAGNKLDTIKAIDDGEGGYVAIYHDDVGAVFNVHIASSVDLETWTHEILLEATAHTPTIGRRPSGSFLVAFESDETSGGVAPNFIVVREYATLADLLAGTHARSINLPRTLAAANFAEGSPHFYSTAEPIEIGFHYNDGTRDKEARGTLTDFTSWSAAADATLDGALVALGQNARGDRDSLTYHHEMVFVEAQDTVGDFSTFSIFSWLGGVATQLAITTHGGSTAHSNITTSIVNDPDGSGGKVLFVGLFFHAGGAAPGEAGQSIYYAALPDYPAAGEFLGYEDGAWRNVPAPSGGVTDHDDLTNVTANQHHAQAHNLDSADHADVDIGSPAVADRLRWNGTDWVNSNLHWEPMVDYDGLVMLDSAGGIHVHEVTH